MLYVIFLRSDYDGGVEETCSNMFDEENEARREERERTNTGKLLEERISEGDKHTCDMLDLLQNYRLQKSVVEK